jgi:hypothetical protein
MISHPRSSVKWFKRTSIWKKPEGLDHKAIEEEEEEEEEDDDDEEEEY